MTCMEHNESKSQPCRSFQFKEKQKDELQCKVIHIPYQVNLLYSMFYQRMKEGENIQGWKIPAFIGGLKKKKKKRQGPHLVVLKKICFQCNARTLY